MLYELFDAVSELLFEITLEGNALFPAIRKEEGLLDD